MSNFLADYMEYSSGNEANPQYHVWSGLVTLASIISRRVWLDFGYFKIAPNLYVVLLGPPGNKKTTAMRLAKTFLYQLCKDNPSSIPFSAQCQSKENLVKELATYHRKFLLPNGEILEYTPISIFVTELTQFLGTQTAGHMLDFLTTVWDGDPYDRATNLHGKEFVMNPCVTVLACTPPDTITSFLKTDVITGGFSRRAVFVLEMEDGTPIPFPTITEAQHAAYERMKQRGNELMNIGGQFEWAPDAREFYDAWYRRHQANLPGDENSRFYFKTKWTQMLKVAMLLNVGKYDELVLQKESVLASLAIFEKTELNLSKVFSGTGRNELASVANRVLELLLANRGPVPRKQVESTLWKNADSRETYSIIQHLLESEKIYEMKEEKNGVTRIWLCLPEHVERIQAEGRVNK